MKKNGLAVILVILATTLCISRLFGETSAGLGFINPKNDRAKMISRLNSEVTAENIADYDFTEQAMEYLEYIGTNLPNRNSTTVNSDHDAARNWIISELRNAGYTDSQIYEQNFQHENRKGVNIILTVEGKDRSQQIIIGGHYDGRGTGDNGSGIALILANAVGLSGKKPPYTVQYIFYDCEEIGHLGSSFHAKNMTDDEVKNTVYMINLDSLAFGDYCNIYGGNPILSENTQEDAVPTMTEGYELAADIAETLGFNVMRTADLDGYYEKYGAGPDIEEGTLYTNPWTYNNPSPLHFRVASPATLTASDHVGYIERGIEYIYFEATNWFAGGEYEDEGFGGMSYTGYIDTNNYNLGEHGMFMNTKYDTWENLNKFFPERAKQHYSIYSPLLSALIMVS